MANAENPRNIGVVITGHATFGLVEGDRVAGRCVRYPPEGENSESLCSMPADELLRVLADEVKALAEGRAGRSPRDRLPRDYPRWRDRGVS